MRTNTLFEILSTNLQHKLPAIFPQKPSVATVKTIVNAIFTTVIELVSQGIDVRISGVGVFYPKTVKRKVHSGENIKLGWTSYPKVDDFLTESMRPLLGRFTDVRPD